MSGSDEVFSKALSPLTSRRAFEEATAKSTTPTLVEFYAPWCAARAFAGWATEGVCCLNNRRLPCATAHKITHSQQSLALRQCTITHSRRSSCAPR